MKQNLQNVPYVLTDINSNTYVIKCIGGMSDLDE